jgi:antitoxin component YwqK of YwqJK toxin-antitoxin module
MYKTNSFFYCFLLILSAPVMAQARKTLKMEATDRVIINRQDTLYEFYTTWNYKKEADVESYYYWYKQDTILVTRGGFDGKLLHGNYKVIYPGKNLAETGWFVNGRKDGEWKKWLPNGQLQQVVHWKKGKKEGAFEEFTTTGQKIRSGFYKQDRADGYLVQYAGDTVASKQLFNNGQPVIPKAPKSKAKKKKK